MEKLKKLLFLIIIIPLSLWLIFILQVGFLFIMMGIIPSMVAYFVDTAKTKPTFKCVLACNLSGMIPTFTDAYFSDSVAASMQMLMGDLFTWFLAWGGATCGYGLLMFSRVLTQITLIISDQARVESLLKQQEKLVQEWGDNVKIRQG